MTAKAPDLCDVGGPLGGDVLPFADPTQVDRFTSVAVNAGSLLASKIEAPRSLLGDGLLTAAGFLLLYGTPGIGKTWHGLMTAYALITGRDWLGIPAHASGLRVGLLQMELSSWHVQQRLDALGFRELDLVENLKIVCRPELRGAVDLFDDEHEVTRLRHWIERDRLDVLMIDALSRTHTADENSATELGRVLARLDALRYDTGCGLHVTHHERKALQSSAKGGSDLDALRGSTRLQSDPTAHVRIKYVRGARCIAFPRVSFGPEPLDIFFEIGKNGVPVVVTSPDAVQNGSAEKTYAALCVAGRPLSRSELEKATRLTKPTVARQLKTLADDGRITKLDGSVPRYAPSRPSHAVSETPETAGRLVVSSVSPLRGERHGDATPRTPRIAGDRGVVDGHGEAR